MNWEDFDGTTRRREDEFVLNAQRAGIDWAVLAQREPYSLEPASSERDLVGRRELLHRLLALTGVGTSDVGSAILSGQKRVGKTSIARALESRLSDVGYHVLYLLSGDYVCPSPEETVATLGRRTAVAFDDWTDGINHWRRRPLQTRSRHWWSS